MDEAASQHKAAIVVTCSYSLYVCAFTNSLAFGINMAWDMRLKLRPYSISFTWHGPIAHLYNR